MITTEYFYFENPNSPIKDLLKSETLQIIRDYRSNTSLDAIAYHNNIRKSTIYRDIPYVLSEMGCDKCGRNIYVKVGKRADLYNVKKYCINCHHDFTTNCGCDFCTEEKALRSEKNKMEYEELWDFW